MTDLPWLPPAPANFRLQCQAIGEAAAPGLTAQHLATHALSASQAVTLGNALSRCRKKSVDLAPLIPFRLGILSNATVDMMADGLPAAAARHGIAVETTIAPYDQVIQQALDPEAKLFERPLDAVLLALDHRWSHVGRASLDDIDGARAGNALAQFRIVAEAVREHGGAPVILQTIPLPPQTLFGGFERNVRGSLRSMIGDLNQGLVQLATELGGYILDIAALAERVGTDRWFDPVQWNHFKLPCALSCNAVYADALAKLMAAIRGRSRKCLVLDLDNTLWSGVIGDDGVEGIEIGAGSAIGEAHLALQQYALDLRERGIILAVCSKNNEETARLPFREHPDMLIRESDIAVFQANWIDKPSNLEAIARTLNIGLDALVLVDDNPAERAEIRAALPMIGIPELPADASWFVHHLEAAGYFEAITFSDDDRLRVKSYAADARRAEVMQKSRNLSDYLKSLEMVISFQPFDGRGRGRITQLINKSNQFNLTTPRYTEAQVAGFEHDPGMFTLQVRLRDRFGDLGMISVVICKPGDDADNAWVIDTWLMSCRVLGRKVEVAMLQEIIRHARMRGVREIQGIYRPTAKNNMVEDHYSKLGFEELETGEAADKVYSLQLDGYVEQELPMAVERQPAMEAAAE